MDASFAPNQNCTVPLCNIATIVLRLYCVDWFVRSIIMLVSATGQMRQYSFSAANYWALFPGVAILVVTILLFYWSHLIARVVTRRANSEISLGVLTQYDLYCFAFTFLGLFFVLSSLPDTIHWIHYSLFVLRDTHEQNPQRADAFYQLTRPLITLISGCACLMFAPRFARKMTSIQSKYDAEK